MEVEPKGNLFSVRMQQERKSFPSGKNEEKVNRTGFDGRKKCWGGAEGKGSKKKDQAKKGKEERPISKQKGSSEDESAWRDSPLL